MTHGKVVAYASHKQILHGGLHMSQSGLLHMVIQVTPLTDTPIVRAFSYAPGFLRSNVQCCRYNTNNPLNQGIGVGINDRECSICGHTCKHGMRIVAKSIAKSDWERPVHHLECMKASEAERFMSQTATPFAGLQQPSTHESSVSVALSLSLREEAVSSDPGGGGYMRAPGTQLH